MDDHILCLLPFPEPLDIMERLRKTYPRSRLTYQRSYLGADWTKNSEVSDTTWHDVTILLTLSIFPPDPSLAPNLKMIHLFSSGTDHIRHQPSYKSSTVPITTCTGVAAPMIAEWVLMMLLTAEHKFNTLLRWHQEHTWDETQGGKGLFFGSNPAFGKRIGILGYGAVGRQVANIASSLGMDVLAFTAFPRLTPESKRYKCYVVAGTGDTEGTVPKRWFSGTSKAELHEFLSQDLDYLLVSLPLSEASRGLLGSEEFRILARRNTFLISVSRGETIDQDALMGSLQEYQNDSAGPGNGGRCGGLSGAALDITNPEPLPPDHPLWDAPNCIITPHIASIFGKYSDQAFRILEINLRNLADGTELLNVINRETGYSSAGT